MSKSNIQDGILKVGDLTNSRSAEIMNIGLRDSLQPVECSKQNRFRLSKWLVDERINQTLKCGRRIPTDSDEGKELFFAQLQL